MRLDEQRRAFLTWKDAGDINSLWVDILVKKTELLVALQQSGNYYELNWVALELERAERILRDLDDRVREVVEEY